MSSFRLRKGSERRCIAPVRFRQIRRSHTYCGYPFRNPVAIFFTLLLLLRASPNQASLSLSEAEQLALRDDPAIAAIQSRSQALQETAVAEGQLPDPKFRAGLFNVPLDTFEIDREPTTQLRLGLQQAFPKGQTLRHRQRRGEWQSVAEQAKADDQSRKLVRDVRSTFLELYYQERAEQVIEETRDLFSQLVDITRAHYASGRVSQQDVLRASLELSRLDDRSTKIRNEAEKRRASLMKWIGEAAGQSIAEDFPELPVLPDKAHLESALENHPVIRAESALIESFQQSVQIAREQYKPGLNVGLEYRKRFGNDPGGDERADMMAAMLTIDLPLLPGKRQDRRLAASRQRAEAARLTRIDSLRALTSRLETDYATWQRLGERAKLYETHLLREARANSRASLKAYQAGLSEFTTLMRARITELDLRLEELRIRVDRAKAQARLLYLAGERP